MEQAVIDLLQIKKENKQILESFQIVDSFPKVASMFSRRPPSESKNSNETLGYSTANPRQQPPDTFKPSRHS
jgi:hypothetical protein